MDMRSIEIRVQNIIDRDIAINRQLALGTKLIHNKFQHYAETIEKKYMVYFDQSRILDASIKTAKELEELLESLQGETVQLKQKIQRLEKKNAVASVKSPECKLSDFDREIHLKREMKLRILNQFTRLFLAEGNTPNRVKGYVTKNTELIPIDLKCNDIEAITDKLWKTISLTSAHKQKWDELFADESSGNQPNITM